MAEGLLRPSALEVGRAYYCLLEEDWGAGRPRVEPMIYLGANILPGDERRPVQHYFQDAVSYYWRGAATDRESAARHPEILIGLVPMQEADIGVRVVTLEGAIAAFQQARARARMH